MTSALDLLMDSDSTAETTTLLESNGICTIDSRTRTIFVSPEIVVGAVQSDKNAERIKFSCPKIVGDNLDLSKFSIRINFENVSSVDPDISIKDQYICEDASINEDNITFSWVIGKNAARYMGTIRFIVCAVKTDSDSNISIEWNTTVAQIPVLEGIEVDQPSLDENNKDIINQLLAITKTASDEAVKNVNSAKEQAITDIQNVSQPDKTLTVEGGIADAKATGNAISSLREDLDNKTKNLKQWNLIDISKVKEGYGYTNSIGYPPTLVTQAGYNAIDDIIPCEAGETYTVNWLYGAIGIYDSDIKRIQHLYIDSIPKTFIIPDGGCYMTLFGGSGRMTDIMLIKGDTLPKKYVPYSIFDIETKKSNNLYGIKWCAFGDSLTDSETLASESSGTKNYVDYVAESLGLSVTNCGKGGTGYLKSTNFMSRVDTIPTDTETLTVFGSFNDYEYISNQLGALGDTGTDTLYGAMYNFINGVYTRCPDVVMGIITPTKWGYLSEQKDALASALCDSYVNALIETAGKWSIPVLDLYHESGLRPWDTNFAQNYYRDDNGDGTANTVHPLDIAHKRFIAPKVENFIKQIYHAY